MFDVEVSTKDILYCLIEVNLISQPLAIPKWDRPQWISVECSMFIPPHHSDHAPTHQNMESFECKATNARPNLPVESKDNSNDEFKWRKNSKIILRALCAKPSQKQPLSSAVSISAPPSLVVDLQMTGINKQLGQGLTVNLGITKSSLDFMESMYSSIATSQGLN
jgi:hypothetical protein